MTLRFPALLAAALALAGCSSAPTQVDRGLIKARTFSFVSQNPKPLPAYADNRDYVHALIQPAITQNLARKGLTQIASGGDVTVAYLVIVGNNVATTSINDYFGYGRDAGALVDKAHEANAVSSKNPNHYEMGTLVIDIVDTRTFALLKRASIQSPILRNTPPDTRAARVQSVVDAALKDLRVSP